MTNITIPRAVLEEAMEALQIGIAHAEYDDASIDTYVAFRDAANPAIEALRAALAGSEKQERYKALDELVKQAQELNMGYGKTKKSDEKLARELAQEIEKPYGRYDCDFTKAEQNSVVLILKAFAKVREDERGKK